MFRVSQHPSSGVLKTVTAASGTGHNFGTATANSLQRGQIWPRWREVAVAVPILEVAVVVPILWPVPEAAVTVFSTPDDGRGGHPKHVEWLCSEINQTAYCCIYLDFYLIYM